MLMKVFFKITVFASLFLGIAFSSCQKDLAGVKGVPLEDFDQTNYQYFEDDLPAHFSGFGFFSGSWNNWANVENANEKATLGRVLFYDKELSLNSTISCGSCHQQSMAFSDGKKFSPGIFGEESTRSSMSLSNMGYQSVFFWENKVRSLQEGVLLPIKNHAEMGMERMDLMPEKLKYATYYDKLFADAFGDTEITEDRMGEALATFVGSLISSQSKYDEGMENNFANYSGAELAGWNLFIGKAGCDNCHNNGTSFTTKWGTAHNIGLDEEYADKGLENGAFKVPTLRNVELTAPYMHDGRFETLEEVVEHYSSGVKDHPYLSFYMREDIEFGGPPKKLNLTETEKSDLVAFLKTLTDEEFLRDPRYANPFK